MSLTRVSTGGPIQASHINQFCDVLQRASGQTESRKYHLSFASYVNSSLGSMYISTLSSGATPVSVSIDTADTAPSGCGSPNTNHLTANGFQLYSFSTGVNPGCNVGGNWTVTY